MPTLTIPKVIYGKSHTTTYDLCEDIVKQTTFRRENRIIENFFKSMTEIVSSVIVKDVDRCGIVAGIIDRIGLVEDDVRLRYQTNVPPETINREKLALLQTYGRDMAALLYEEAVATVPEELKTLSGIEATIRRQWLQ